ncbi:unnamed protein product [Haemonchus placei]|uniref:7TM_GPCR_Srx domain-containing protein n=1 Tax=Haemonchus placei TaxID=6290 RepID=A0A0N4VU68_HAEPC|nr:unnamed protein product [Haemonchus placei]
MTVKLWLGVLLGFATIAGLVLTLTVLYAVIKLGIITKKNPIYVISAANMMCDTIQLLLALLYLAPSIIFDDWIFKGGRRGVMVELLSATFLACWYYGSVAQILMAVNRLVVVCFPTNSIFSMRNVSIFVIILLRTIQLMAITFRFSFDHKFLSYSYTSIEDVFNYSNSYIDLPLNSSSSAICAICYTYVGWRGIPSAGMCITAIWKTYRNRHVFSRYALQFCAISMFYLGAWVTFRVFPVLIGDRGVEYFIVVSMCVTVNSSANAFVYITSNQEVCLAGF